MRSRSVTFTLPALVAVALVSAGCSAPSTAQRPTTTTRASVTTTPRTTTTSTAARPASVGVCVETATNKRVADDRCDTSDASYKRFWYKHTDTLVYPAVGAAIVLAAGSFLRPSTGDVYDRGAPVAGGTVLRGGLGQRPDSSGGGGSSGS
ncbi:hypothetical protein [Nocardia rosealba]|uniref:hypothetical protein n=1 Tax=Nocardia rosealba TaxID=2878563 RepID=UPI001CD9D9AE|nr:hypothetical protein [Nocardia rosealba]MCA2210805.1 hypothetical protein [Nocardia rosealba]